ncbi:hypothetical protein OUZ56_021603 [Daphnia magna]|uniref:Secreted protein n=1 Tax=Daphnia magna TaxID=35525 RepID=A0ABR0AU10_9CRUS|nr:hypothetical protein OUZ56_021603 [Daphnia magna]
MIVIVVVFASVHHSQSFNADPPLQPWAACHSNGYVLFAHCSCTAGRTIEVDNFSTQKSPTQPFLTEFCAPFVNSFDAAIVCPEMFSRDSIR